MDDGGRRCALPGCDVEIEAVHGRPERRYCGAGHRAAARQARRAAVHAQQRRAAAGGPAEALPWLPDPAAAGGGEPRPPVDPEATGPVLRPVTPRPAVPHPPRVGEPGPVARAAARRSPDGRHRDDPPRHRRTLAMIGIAGLLAGGYAVTAGSDPPPPAPVQAVPDGEPADAWAQRASVALAAVNGQLGTLAQAEARWEELPASRADVVPAPVAALREHRALLERRRADLQSRLDAYRALRATERDLAASEPELRALEEALVDVPPPPRRSPEQEAAVAALTEQRDLRIRGREAQRAELASLADRVAAATRAPLPDDGAATARISGEVLDLVRDGVPRSRPAPQPRDTAPAPRPDGSGGRAPDGDPPRRGGDPADPSTPRGGSEGRRGGTTTREPAAPASDRDVLAQLHEQARRVAREAAQAEAERAVAGWEPAGPATAAPAPAAHRADDDEIEERNAARSAGPAGPYGVRDGWAHGAGVVADPLPPLPAASFGR